MDNIISIYFTYRNRKYTGIAYPLLTDNYTSYYNIAAPNITLTIEPRALESKGIVWVNRKNGRENDLTRILGEAIETAEC